MNSVLISALAVMGVRDGGGWHNALDSLLTCTLSYLSVCKKSRALASVGDCIPGERSTLT